jgi:PiT family inorganic phosphate transporter
VGVANQLMQGNSGTAGVDWEQVKKVFKALLVSPVDRLCRWRRCCSAVQAGGARSAAVQGAGGHGAAAVLYPLPADLTCGGVSYLRMGRTTGRRAWA